MGSQAQVEGRLPPVRLAGSSAPPPSTASGASASAAASATSTPSCNRRFTSGQYQPAMLYTLREQG